MPAQLIEAPASDASREIVPLGYVEAYDAVNNDDYAFAAYKEVDRAGGAWRVRIAARQMTGVVFEPDAMRSQARAAGAQGKAYFTWGNGIDPSNGDPRMVQYRVHVKDGAPARIEIALQTRKADHGVGQTKSLAFDWPA